MESHKNHVPNHQPVYNHHIPIVVGLYPFLPLLTITINRIYGGLGWETSHILRFGPSLNTVQHGGPRPWKLGPSPGNKKASWG